MSVRADAGPTIARMVRAMSAFWAARRAVSLVEFAMILPVAITMYLGSYQIGDAITCNRRITIATRAVADLVAQNATGTTTASELDGDLSAVNLVLAPYSPTQAIVRITEVATDSLGRTTVQWSRATNAKPYVKGSVATIPLTMRIPGTYFLFSEVTYAYTPAANFGFVNSMKLYDSLYMIPRNATSISCSDC